MGDAEDLQWFAVRGHWIIRKVPYTKDDWYVACGHPPQHVLNVYKIKLT